MQKQIINEVDEESTSALKNAARLAILAGTIYAAKKVYDKRKYDKYKKNKKHTDEDQVNITQDLGDGLSL